MTSGMGGRRPGVLSARSGSKEGEKKSSAATVPHTHSTATTEVIESVGARWCGVVDEVVDTWFVFLLVLLLP